MNALDQIGMMPAAQVFKNKKEYKGKIIEWNNPSFVFVKIGATPRQCFLGVAEAEKYIDFAASCYAK